MKLWILSGHTASFKIKFGKFRILEILNFHPCFYKFCVNSDKMQPNNEQQQQTCFKCSFTIFDKKVINQQGLHRLEKYLNIQVCFEKSLKIKFALKST